MVSEKKNTGINRRPGAGIMALCMLIALAAMSPAQDGEECLDCHPGYFEEYGGKFNHSPFEQEDCYACHKFHGFRNAMELIGPLPEVCGFCHEAISELDEETTHAPVSDEASCLNCHKPHSGASKNLLILPEKQVCIECHDSPDDDFRYSHPPYKDSVCVECHNPHGSPYGKFFSMPIEYVCMGCHGELLGEIDPADLHAADENQSCDKCHTGHNSPYKALLHAESDQLCLDCHNSIKQKLDRSEKHAILEDEGCLACHQPHFQKTGQHLVEEGQALCFACHGEIEEKLEAEFVHAAAEDECVTCHDPHIKMNPETESELCADCHDYSDDDFLAGHLNMVPKTCSGCHDPHGSGEKNLVRENGHPPFADRDCEICHDQIAPGEKLQNDDLCLDCHDIDDSGSSHENLDLVQKRCIFCHSPHSSAQKSLLK